LWVLASAAETTASRLGMPEKQRELGGKLRAEGGWPALIASRVPLPSPGRLPPDEFGGSCQQMGVAIMSTTNGVVVALNDPPSVMLCPRFAARSSMSGASLRRPRRRVIDGGRCGPRGWCANGECPLHRRPSHRHIPLRCPPNSGLTVAAKVGRTLHWDAKKEVFENDAEASRLPMRELREPYDLIRI